MNKSDEEIQKMLESRRSIHRSEVSGDEQEDLKIYSRLFEELIKTPDENLSYSFSANVVRKIRQEKQRRSEVNLTILVAALITTGLVGFASSPYFDEVLPAIEGSKWIIFASLLVLAVVQFLDQKLIQERRIPK